MPITDQMLEGLNFDSPAHGRMTGLDYPYAVIGGMVVVRLDKPVTLSQAAQAAIDFEAACYDGFTSAPQFMETEGAFFIIAVPD